MRFDKYLTETEAYFRYDRIENVSFEIFNKFNSKNKPICLDEINFMEHLFFRL